MNAAPARCPSIAVIGAGFSGTMVAVHLLREARTPLRVVLIERAETAGVGVAYREQSDRHLLNVRAEGMSAFPDQPGHFVKWLIEQRGDESLVNPAAFMPRRLYGQYLRALLSEAAANCARDVRLELVNDEITGLGLRDGRVSLKRTAGAPLLVDQAVLALGNPGPADPAVADPAFYGSPLYQAHAWSSQGLLSLRLDDAVLLVGSGLTTLDWIASLAERGHRGPIHIVSRRGLLPQEHRIAPRHALGFDPQALPSRVRPLLRAIRAEVEALASRGGDWRSVIDALRPQLQALWQGLPAIERQRFLRHVRSHWDSHRHRAAPRHLDTVQRLMRQGQLELLAARPLAYLERGDSVDVHLRPRGRDVTLVRSVHRVVNCTGPDSNYRRLNPPLLQSLCEQGLATVDSLGLGLATDADGALIDSRGKASTLLHTLGPTRKGSLWETTAVPEIRVQAQALASALLLRVESARTGPAAGRSHDLSVVRT